MFSTKCGNSHSATTFEDDRMVKNQQTLNGKVEHNTKIGLYVLAMSRTRVRVNPHSIVT